MRSAVTPTSTRRPVLAPAPPVVPCRQCIAHPASSVVVQAEFGPWRAWKHLKTNKNGNWIRERMNVKTGDTVVVIAGDDRGKVGKIMKVWPKYQQVWMDGVNLKYKFQEPEYEGDVAERVEVEFPIHVSNVMHWSEQQQVRSRVGHKWENGKKVRYLKKTGEVIDDPSRSRKSSSSGDAQEA